VLLAAATIACNSSTVAPDTVPPTAQRLALPAARTAAFDAAARSVSSLYSEVPRGREVVRTAERWTALWGQLTANVQPAPPAPAVDFAAEMVVVAAMGTKPTGGFAIAIDGVHVDRDRLFVEVRETSPGRSCIVTQALTAPVALVIVPARAGTATFLERKETTAC
jgi:hypothetical protein